MCANLGILIEILQVCATLQSWNIAKILYMVNFVIVQQIAETIVHFVLQA